MKKTLVTSALIAAVSTYSYAALSVQDSFLTGSTPANGEYTVGGVAGQNPATLGHNAAWANGSTNSPQITATGLTYSNASGTLNTAGGALVTNNSNTRTGRTLTSPITNATTSTTLYVSFLLKLETVGTINYRAFELNNGPFAAMDANRTLQLGHGSNNTDFGANSQTIFGLRLLNNNSLFINLGAADTNVNLFVMRFDLSSTDNSDSITVWRNPSMGGAEPGTNNGTLNTFNMAFDRTALAKFGTFIDTNVTGDELRFGDSFASVTPIPEPSTGILAGFAGLALALRRRRA